MTYPPEFYESVDEVIERDEKIDDLIRAFAPAAFESWRDGRVVMKSVERAFCAGYSRGVRAVIAQQIVLQLRETM